MQLHGSIAVVAGGKKTRHGMADAIKHFAVYRERLKVNRFAIMP